MTSINQKAADIIRANAPKLVDNSLETPSLTFVGQPLMFIAIDPSAMMQGGIPLEICWTLDSARQPTSRIIKPPLDWQDRPRDDFESSIHGMTVSSAINRGEPLQQVATETYAALNRCRLVSIVPSFDRVWLTELFLQTPLDPCFKYLSLSDVALKIVAKTGLDDDTFARTAIQHWFRMLEPGPAAKRVKHMARLINAITKVAIAKGLIDPGQSFELDG